MDIESVRKQRAELEKLMGSKFKEETIKYGIELLSNQQVGAMISCSGLTSMERITHDKNDLLEKINALEKENKELKHKLVLKTLGMN